MTTAHAKSSNLQAPRAGYVLVVTLALSALMMLAVLTLLAVSLGQTRVNRSDILHSRAQANALIAMQIAIGEVQREAGPDQRITATASILPDAQQPHLLGVWDSWTPDPLAPGVPDYQAAKSQHFRKWIRSGLTPAEASDLNQARAPINAAAPENITLLGTGTLGSSAPMSDHVVAGKMTVALPDGSNAGGMAYAVLDEGIKARVDLPPADTSKIRSAAEAMATVGAPPRTAVEKADGSLASLAGHQAEIAGAPSLDSLALPGGLPPDTIRQFTHDLTTSSAGVLVDVAKGGLRKDLSMLFEMRRMADAPEIANRRLYSDTTTPLGPQDPAWTAFFNHASLNKASRTAGLATVLGNPGFIANNTVKPSAEPGFNIGLTDFNGTSSVATYKDNTQPHTPIAPVIAKCEIFFSVFVKRTHGQWVYQIPSAFNTVAGQGWDYTLHLIYQPVVTLWNPYNVPVQMDNARVEIETPPVGLKFRRIPAPGTSIVSGTDISGDINTTFVPLNQAYVFSTDRNRSKRFVLNLFHDRPANNSYPTDRSIKFQPGEVRLFSPNIPATAVQFDNIQTDSGSISLYDYQNQALNDIPSTPGWNGYQYGFSIDWLNPNHNGYYDAIAKKNGPVNHSGVIATRLTDSWEVVVMPTAQPGSSGAAFRNYKVSLADSSGRLYSQLDFDHGGNNTTLATALTNSTTTFPLTCGPFLAADYLGSDTQPIANNHVLPLFALTAQAKTSRDEPFPNRPWIHANTSRPLVHVDLAKEKQSWNSHELVIRKLDPGGIPFDPAHGRAYHVSGRDAATGTTFGVMRDTPLIPVQGIAQLAQVNLAGLSRLHPNVDNPIGQSFAHPLIPADKIRHSSSALGYEIFDHSYLANHRLWDGWFASTLANYRSLPFTGTSLRSLDQVTSEFFAPTPTSLPLLNPRFTPWFGSSGGPTEAVAALANGNASTGDGYKKSAAFMLLRGAFNVNSTSVPAWKALLACLNEAAIPLLAPTDANASTFTLNKTGVASASVYFSKSRLANALPPGRTGTGPAEWQLWNGGRELTDAELDALANRIVDEVKLRGPFLSLAEFVNRRIASGSGSEQELALMGTLQAAIQKAGLGAAQTMATTANMLGTADVANSGYAFPLAAEGSTGEGASSSLDQLALLNQLGSFLTARSDTFRIRFYGEATAPGGGTDRAYGEAVIQRVPDYLNTGDAADGSPSLEDNQVFGRRFHIISFRWLSAGEI